MTSETPCARFRQESLESLERLQADVRFLLDCSPIKVERARDLQRALGVRAPLAWQVFRFARSTSPAAMVDHIPYADSMLTVLKAAEEEGFGADAVERVRASYGRFERVVERHAGNRSTFEAMVSGMTGVASEQIEQRLRRSAFRANAQIWGAQCKLLYRCAIYGIGPEGSVTSVIIQGARRIRALRPMREIPVCRRTVTVTHAEGKAEQAPEVIRAELLEEFSSPGIPPLTEKKRGSFVHDYVTVRAVGLTAEIDLFLSTKLRSGITENEPEAGLTSMVRVPSEWFVADMIVPAGEFDAGSARWRVGGCLEDVSAAENAPADLLLKGPEPAEHLGCDLEAMNDELMPRCAEMMRYVLRDLGRSRGVFDIFRCKVRYPMLHTSIGLLAQRAGRGGSGGGGR